MEHRNKDWAMQKVTLAVLGGLTLLGWYTAAAPLPDGKLPQAIDPNQPSTWEVRARETETELIELGKALIAVAKDRQRDNADRRKAILALGDVGTSDSIDFLVEHIRLSLPFDKSAKDTIRELDTP